MIAISYQAPGSPMNEHFRKVRRSSIWRDQSDDRSSGFAMNSIVHADSIEAIKKIPSSSAHLILSDIPYGIGAEDWDVLHNNTNTALLGSSPAQEKAGAIFKKRGKPINGWSDADRMIPHEYYNWCSTWAAEWLRILKPGGSAIIFPGRRMMHRATASLEDAGFNYRDTIAWLRTKAPHRAQRLSIVFERRKLLKIAADFAGWRVGNLRPTFEPIVWCFKPYRITIADNVLEHGVGAYNEEAYAKYVDKIENVIRSGFSANEGGLHPTQKPLQLMAALIELTTLPGQVVIDPFAGSGTTLLAAKYLDRKYLGFEVDKNYYETASERLQGRLI